MPTHESLMLEAIELSRLGFPAPNPHVGCVIVQHDEIVGRGFCEHDGGDHAEAVALRKAGEKAIGGTAYVTLEPCNHMGRTPPCSEALVRAGIRKVVIAVREPNPVAAGGIDFLTQRGVDVEVGLCSDLAAAANAQFLFAMTQRRPMVTIKAGMTLDGKVVMSSGESQWITNASSRLDAMHLRADAGCVLIGRATAEQDRARLTVRGVEVVNQPLRVVIDLHNRLDGTLPIFDDSARTLHLTSDQTSGQPADILARILEQKCTGVLIEGGPTTNAHFIRGELVDQVILYVAPTVFGEGKSWIGTFGLEKISESPRFELVQTRMIDGDVKLTYQSRNLCRFLASYKV